ncbi:MAG TPA: class I SAM-dependent methyltransferase [Acidimicrobiia bacterium]
MSESTWESSRSWHLMRWLVYFLREDLVSPDMAAGADVLDFSAGLGDLSAYMADCGARSVLATRPELEPGLAHHGIEWATAVGAGNVVEKLRGRTFDLVVARMVFQFPTWEGDRADPDTMIEEFGAVLRPGGRLVAAFHEFVSLEGHPSSRDLPDVSTVLDSNPDLGALVDFLGLPPREGPLGETGFGLKVSMFVDSLVSKGFAIETADNPEAFTFPTDLEGLSDDDIVELGVRVIELKSSLLAHVPDRYDRPARVRKMLVELAEFMPHVAWPIARIVARKL